MVFSAGKHGGNIYRYGSPEDIIDFSSNINPYGPLDSAMAAAAASLPAIVRYPDANQTQICSAFSSWLRTPPENFVFGNGASELIAAALAALHPRRLIVCDPTFSEYESCALRLGIPVLNIAPCEDFSFPMEQISTHFGRGDIFIACQPNNPTGRAWSACEVMRLAEQAQARGGWLLVDECFINLTFPAAFSALGLIGDGRVIVLRAITKDFSAPGLRVGFIVARSDVSGLIRSELQPWPLNSVGESYAIAAAESPEPFLDHSRRKIAECRVALVNGLLACGFNPLSSVVNFLLVASDTSATALHESLIKRGILIRRCSTFRGLGDRYFRVAVRTEAENAQLLFELSRVKEGE